MNVHEQFADDLSLYALGGLLGEDRVALEKHLEGVPAAGMRLSSCGGIGLCWVYRPVAQNLHCTAGPASWVQSQMNRGEPKFTPRSAGRGGA
jgi:hypothetical protein